MRNKMDELQANVLHLENFRDACILAFTETWLTSADPQSDFSLPGFGTPVRLDRDPAVTGKSHVCTQDIEMLSVADGTQTCSGSHTDAFLTTKAKLSARVSLPLTQGQTFNMNHSAVRSS
ncbi:hypothetical protein WMY93_033482 [Mugilogobius chulae]|uniref:Uncharacterized protein n=1 Tax=Mugilogobius chulae TaxID=88201 RepID=A0AAW0MTQ5_9GOBI